MTKQQIASPELQAEWDAKFATTTEWCYGWKALFNGASYYNNEEFAYPLPQPGQKWGPVFVHPEPAETDRQACGAGRLHVHNRPTCEYAKSGSWLWYARYPEGSTVGRDDEKTGVIALQLRRVSWLAFCRMIRLGWMRAANLEGANLYGANLYGANLRGANLRGANLRAANLRAANLHGANLHGANLRAANLEGANLRGAHLHGAHLHNANLRAANLRGANLEGAVGVKDNLTIPKEYQS